ncbi:MAG: hypothetical protein ACQEQV_08230, partial [Fibrobacterota bacterium]
EKDNYTWRKERRLKVDHSLSFLYEPIQPITSISFDLSVDRNFERFLYDWDGNSLNRFIDEGVLFSYQPGWREYRLLYSEIGRNQNYDMSLSPNVGRWLDLDFDLSGGYNHDLDLASDSLYLESDITSKFRTTANFRMDRLFSSLAERARERTRTDSGSRRESSPAPSVSGRIADALDVINLSSLNFSYSADMGLDNNFLTPSYFDTYLQEDFVEFFKYSTGLYGRSAGDIITGDMNDSSFFGGVQHRNLWYTGVSKNGSDRRTTKRNVSVNTSFDIPGVLDLSIRRISLGHSVSYNITPETDRFDTSRTWPDIQAEAQTSFMEDIDRIQSRFSRFSISTGYTFNKKEKKYSSFWDTSAPGSEYDLDNTYTYGFSPLLDIDGALRRRNIDVGYTFDLTFDTTVSSTFTLVEAQRNSSAGLALQKGFNSADYSVNRDHRWRFSWRKKGEPGQTFELFEGRKLDVIGDIVYSADFSLRRAKNRYYTAENNGGLSDPNTYEEQNISFKPNVTYTFTDKIDFYFYYNLQREVYGESQNVRNSDELAGQITVRF